MPLRVVFDTNVVISALVFSGRLAWLRPACTTGAVSPIICKETTEELLRVLAYPKFRLARGDQEALLVDYLPFAEVVKLPQQRPPLPKPCRDRDDAVFLDLAIAAQCDALVTGDTDISVLRSSAPCIIWSVTELQTHLKA
jgi:putative PIN family toxin of toxin-antitoxin system